MHQRKCAEKSNLTITVLVKFGSRVTTQCGDTFRLQKRNGTIMKFGVGATNFLSAATPNEISVWTSIFYNFKTMKTIIRPLLPKRNCTDFRLKNPNTSSKGLKNLWKTLSSVFILDPGSPWLTLCQHDYGLFFKTHQPQWGLNTFLIIFPPFQQSITPTGCTSLAVSRFKILPSSSSQLTSHFRCCRSTLNWCSCSDFCIKSFVSPG